MNFKKYAAVLAAGKNTRMNNVSNKLGQESLVIKAFVELAGVPLILHVLHTLITSREKFELIFIVHNELYTEKHFTIITNFINKLELQYQLKINFEFILQESPQLGTAHAITKIFEKTFYKDMLRSDEWLAVFFVDNPLITTNTINKIDQDIIITKNSSAGIIAGFECNQPNQYGRIQLLEENCIEQIHEYKDYKNNQEIMKIDLCNSGICYLKIEVLQRFLSLVQNTNQAQEFYLLDVIKFAKPYGYKFDVFIFNDPIEAQGINSFAELNLASQLWQVMQRKKFADLSIIFSDIDSVYFAPFVEIEPMCKIGFGVVFKPNVKIAHNCIIENYCILGPNIEIKPHCVIKSHSIISDSKIDQYCEIGPFAHLNNHNTIGQKNIIGNFVEIKRSEMGLGNKAKHFTYIGDGQIGNKNNFGAGVIFCNYDGKNKHNTIIGDENMIGANVSLIAPIQIGNYNLLAAGSVINKNIDDAKLAIERSQQKITERKKDIK